MCDPSLLTLLPEKKKKLNKSLLVRPFGSAVMPWGPLAQNQEKLYISSVSFSFHHVLMISMSGRDRKTYCGMNPTVTYKVSNATRPWWQRKDHKPRRETFGGDAKEQGSSQLPPFISLMTANAVCEPTASSMAPSSPLSTFIRWLARKMKANHFVADTCVRW